MMGEMRSMQERVNRKHENESQERSPRENKISAFLLSV